MEDSDPNPYQILHLNPTNVTITDVKNAYRKMALLYHPDKCDGDDTVFNQVKNAYQTIMNELKGKTSTYTYQSLKENYQQFVNQQSKSTAKQSPKNVKKKSSIRQNKSKAGSTNQTGEEEENNTEAKVSDFDLAKFNKKFIESQQKKSEIPIDLTDEDFKQRKDTFFQNKKNIEEELNRVGKMFTTSAAFDRNIFNRQFEHLNGNKEERSKELAKYEDGEPLPMTSSNLDQFSSIYDERQKKKDFCTPSNQFEVSGENEKFKNNPENVDEKLSAMFCQERDITTQEAIDPNVISQKIKEYKSKNIHALSKKANTFLKNGGT